MIGYWTKSVPVVVGTYFRRRGYVFPSSWVRVSVVVGTCFRRRGYDSFVVDTIPSSWIRFLRRGYDSFVVDTIPSSWIRFLRRGYDSFVVGTLFIVFFFI